MHHNSLASSTLHWKRVADQEAEEYLERKLNHINSGPQAQKQSQGWDSGHTSPERSINTTRKTQYDGGESETGTDEEAPHVTDRQEPKEEEGPWTREGHETTFRKQAKTDSARTEEFEAHTLPEIPTTEDPTHIAQDIEEIWNTIQNMNITEIISHTSARIMSDIGERLKESICFRGRWNREKGTQEDTHTTPLPGTQIRDKTKTRAIHQASAGHSQEKPKVRKISKIRQGHTPTLVP